MTRRLIVTLALVVFGAVVISTLLTITAGAARARTTTTAEVADTASILAQRGNQTTATRDRLPAYCSLAAVSGAFRLETISCVTIATDGSIEALSIGNRTLALPGLLPRRVALGSLQSGDALTGTRARKVWALRAVTPAEVGRQPTTAVVVTRKIENPVSVLGIRWLIISGLLTTAAGVLAAWLLGRRLAGPLRRASAATRELAAGRLESRLPVDEAASSDDELAELSRSINALAASLQRSRGLEQRFLLSVSHDLRTPLTSIRGYADALADGTLTDVAKGAAVIQQESVRLERLVGDLLDLAKLDARAFRFEIQRIDLTRVARGLVDALEPDARRAGIGLSLATPDPVAVIADPDRAAQVVANLVENALKFAISQVRLEVVLDPFDRSFALLRVLDDGPGISPEDIPHVFERLYVSKRVPVRKEAGSGLGLAIVHELAEAMGGAVAVQPVEPRGTCFSVRLPLADRPGATAGPPGPQPPGSA